MENNTNETEIAVTKGNSPVDADVTIMQVLDGAGSQHHADAAAIIAAIDKVEAMIRDFVLAAPGRRTKIASKASIPDNALHKTALALTKSQNLVDSAGITAEEVMDMIQYTIAYRGVEARAHQLYRGVGDTVAEKRASVGGRCTKVLNIAREMTVKDDHRELIPWLRDMEEAYRARRRKSSQTDDERAAVNAIRKAKRRATSLLIDVNTTPQATETRNQFKAGRDLEP